MEEGYYQSTEQPAATAAVEAPPADYDQVFPALPTVQPVAPQAPHHANSWNNKMRIGSSVVTQVFQIPHDERRIDQNDSFGEKESMRLCSSIMKETDAHIELSSCKNGSLTFLVTGKQDSVLDARRRILQSFQTQASSVVLIPKAHHKVILGKAGQRLKDLEKQTSTKISVPLITDQSDKITVQGTRDNVDKAVHEIHKISVEQAKKAFEEINVEKELHPFIVGAYNERIQDLMNKTNTRIHVPPPSVQAHDITIAGEKEGVEIAKQQIQAQVDLMRKKYTHVSIEVSKAQHKYVIGPRGTNIQEILSTCGVSVEMPPLDSQQETITLRGPQEKLGVALSKVYEKANSGKTTELSAPSWINFYIIGKKGANIKQITQDYPKVHVQFNQEEEKVIIEGPPDDVDAVAGMLNEKISSLLQDKTFQILTVDPKYFKHIIGKSGANINRLKEQTGVDIKISSSDQSQTIKITGSKEGVTSAAKELEEQIAKMELEKEKDMVIDCKYHKVLIGHQGANVKEIRDKFPQVQITFPSIEQKSDLVKLRGPKDEVDKCFKFLSKKVKEILENNSCTLTLPVYQECQRFIIGKGGANIRKLREETNTQIELPEGRNIINITGKKENVQLAKERIMSLQHQQISAVTEDVRISPKFYNSLIGAQGKIINSIEEDCGVKITFPSADSKSDVVTVVGPKDGVDKAKALLLEQVSEREANSYTEEIRTNHQNHRFLIGKSGSKIKKIRETTGTRIIFPSEKDDDKELITIIGKKEAVLQAKAELEAAIEKIDSVVETEMEVDQKHHKHFVAKRCEVLHKIEEEFGVTISFPRSGDPSNRVTVKGPPNMVEPAKQRILEIVKDLDERIEINVDIPSQFHSAIMGFKGSKVKDIEFKYDVKIKMPEKVSEVDNEGEEMVNGSPRPQDIVKVSGKPENCEQAAEALRLAIPITEEFEVPFEYHGGIIGMKGQSIWDLMKRYDVNIVVPKTELELNSIKITGCRTAIDAAKEGLIEKMKELDEEKQDKLLKSFKVIIPVDPEYHPKIIGRKGATITKIKEDYGVQINIPRKGDPDEEMITIIGYEDKVNQAKEEIMSIVSQLNERAREEVSIDSRVHARLIGAKGRNIRKIMDEYGVEIKFPRSSDPDPNLVIISGDEEHILDAKERLLFLEEEYLDDVNERGRYQMKREEVKSVSTNGSGFVVKGAPWERGSGGGGGGGNNGGNNGANANAPDVASQQDFPSFQGSSAANTTNKSTPWGPRR